MKSIQSLVTAELEENPFIIEVLVQGLANINAIADKIQPAIEKRLGNRAERTTVAMAIRRYIASAKKLPLFNWQYPEHLEVATKTQIFEIAFERTPRTDSILEKLAMHRKKSKGDFLSIVEGTYEVVVFSNQKNKPTIKSILRRQTITSELDNLGYVTVNWEKETKDIAGIYYRITQALAYRNISIQSFHTIGAEMMLLFRADACLDAHKVILQLLSPGDPSETL